MFYTYYQQADGALGSWQHVDATLRDAADRCRRMRQEAEYFGYTANPACPQDYVVTFHCGGRIVYTQQTGPARGWERCVA